MIRLSTIHDFLASWIQQVTSTRELIVTGTVSDLLSG